MQDAAEIFRTNGSNNNPRKCIQRDKAPWPVWLWDQSWQGTRRKQPIKISISFPLFFPHSLPSSLLLSNINFFKKDKANVTLLTNGKDR